MPSKIQRCTSKIIPTASILFGGSVITVSYIFNNQQNNLYSFVNAFLLIRAALSGVYCAYYVVYFKNERISFFAAGIKE